MVIFPAIGRHALWTVSVYTAVGGDKRQVSTTCLRSRVQPQYQSNALTITPPEWPVFSTQLSIRQM